MGLDHLGLPMLTIKDTKTIYRDLVSSDTPLNKDTRFHLNGPFVGLRRILKEEESERLKSVEERRAALRKLLESDRQQFMCELAKQGRTLFSNKLY